MIINPTPGRLLAAVREELKIMVVPVVGDQEVLSRLSMIDSILASVIARCDNELRWLNEEIAEIEEMAEALVTNPDPAVAAVAAALHNFRALRSDGKDLGGLQKDYNLASEVLSCALEAGMRLGGELRSRTEQVLEKRLRREVEIRGDFSLAGRQ